MRKRMKKVKHEGSQVAKAQKTCLFEFVIGSEMNDGMMHLMDLAADGRDSCLQENRMGVCDALLEYWITG